MEVFTFCLFRFIWFAGVIFYFVVIRLNQFVYIFVFSSLSLCVLSTFCFCMVGRPAVWCLLFFWLSNKRIQWAVQ